MRRISPPTGCVVSAQNGLNERVIAEAVGRERTIGCFVNFGADYMGPGVVMYGGRGAVVVGELDGAVTPRIERLHALLARLRAGRRADRATSGAISGAS